jgi:hypothetical protein
MYQVSTYMYVPMPSRLLHFINSINKQLIKIISNDRLITIDYK